MNSNKNIFTRTRRHIDNRVWLTMVLISVVSVALLSYRLTDEVNCAPVSIVLDGYTAGKENSYYVGEEISFAAKMHEGKSVVWDFGDHTRGSGAIVRHHYDREGTFTVTATVNGKCEEYLRLNIIELRVPVSLNTTMQNPIEGPDAMRAQEPANFSVTTSAGAYEWTVLNSPDFPVQTGEVATFTFLSPGTRIIELKLDNDAKRTFRKTVQVLPALVVENKPLIQEPIQPVIPPPSVPKEEPREAEAEKPKSVVIANEEFVNLFNQVTEGKKDLQSFNQYLCNGERTKVLANGTDWETMVSFYQKINERKKYDIKSVEAVRDPETNCVTVLKVKYKKRALGIF